MLVLSSLLWVGDSNRLSKDVPEIQSRLEQLESRMSLVELKIAQFHEQTCALVANYADLVSVEICSSEV